MLKTSLLKHYGQQLYYLMIGTNTMQHQLLQTYIIMNHGYDFYNECNICALTFLERDLQWKKFKKR